MSNVQLSSCTLERLAARRTFPLHARTDACRNLFGPVDHDELNREMKSKLREISERDQRRWNFNFETDTPLSGDYQWEDAPADKTPVFYQDSVQIGKARLVVPTKPSVDLVPEDCSVGDVTQCKDRLAGSESSLPGSSEVNQENRSDKLNSGKPSRKATPCVRRKRAATDLTTSHITDFYSKRRRTSDGKLSESTCQHSAIPSALEQTPRKRIR